MTLRKTHGAFAKTGKAPVTVEMLPPDELPAPLPAGPELVRRREDGTIVDSASAKALGARGGLVKAQKRRFLSELGFEDVSPDNPLWKHWRAAQTFIETLQEQFAGYAGGFLSAGISAMLHNAGCEYLKSKYYFDKWTKSLDSEDARMHSKCAEAYLKHCTYSFEYVIREAKVSRDADPRGRAISFANIIELAEANAGAEIPYAEAEAAQDVGGEPSEE